MNTSRKIIKIKDKNEKIKIRKWEREQKVLKGAREKGETEKDDNKIEQQIEEQARQRNDYNKTWK